MEAAQARRAADRSSSRVAAASIRRLIRRTIFLAAGIPATLLVGFASVVPSRSAPHSMQHLLACALARSRSEHLGHFRSTCSGTTGSVVAHAGGSLVVSATAESVSVWALSVDGQLTEVVPLPQRMFQRLLPTEDRITTVAVGRTLITTAHKSGSIGSFRIGIA